MCLNAVLAAAFSVGVSLLDGATPVVMPSPAAPDTSLNISTGALAELATALDTPMIVRKVRTESRHHSPRHKVVGSGLSAVYCPVVYASLIIWVARYFLPCRRSNGRCMVKPTVPRTLV